MWKEQTDFFPLLANEERPPPPLLFNSALPTKHACALRWQEGTRPLGLRQCAQQRTPRPVDLSKPSLSTTHYQNHGRSDSSFGRTANHRLVHLPRAAAGEYICPGFGWERAPEAHPDPKCHSGTICPRPSACVPTSSHRPCPQCAPARPGTKTQGFGGGPLWTITTNAVRIAHYTQTRPQEGGGALCAARL